MATPLPYLASNKNLATLFAKIRSAKVPDKFTHSFLQSTIGLKGTNDRPFIPLLRSLRFVDQSGTPTQDYRLLKTEESSKAAIAAALKNAYAPLFEADENANTLSFDKLKGLIAQVAGTDEAMTGRIASTFAALSKLADFSEALPIKSEKEDEDATENEEAEGDKYPPKRNREQSVKSIRPEFHYNIQVHLPSNGTEEVYLNIFNALRKTFQ